MQTFDTRLLDVERTPAQLLNEGLDEEAFSVTVIKEEPCDELTKKEDLANAVQKDLTMKTSKSLFPSIDIEINVTISIDSGSILLHSGTTG